MAGLGDLWDLILASLEAMLFTVYLLVFRATRWFLQVRLNSPSPPPSPHFFALSKSCTPLWFRSGGRADECSSLRMRFRQWLTRWLLSGQAFFQAVVPAVLSA